MTLRRFFDPVIISPVWQLEGYSSYLEWDLDQHVETSDRIDILLLVSVALNIILILLW